MKTSIFLSSTGLEIEYIFSQAKIDSQVMVVSFPGLGVLPGGEWGYIVTLRQLNANCLFIRANKDYRLSKFTYINREPKIEEAVLELVGKYKHEYRIERIIATGSSMGGFCSAYYGLKYNWDIIAGSPNYLFETDDHSIAYAAGESSKEALHWLNEKISDVFQNAGVRGFNKKIFLSWGEGEENWTRDVVGPQLLRHLETAGIKCRVELFPFANHGTIHEFFPEILKSVLTSYLYGETIPDFKKWSNSQSILLTKKITNDLNTIYSLVNSSSLSNYNYKISKLFHYGDFARKKNFLMTIDFKKKKLWPINSDISFQNYGVFYVLNNLKWIDFTYQDTILALYEETHDDDILEWCVNNVNLYFNELKGNLKRIDKYFKKKRSSIFFIKNFHYFLALRCIGEGKIDDRLAKVLEENIRENLLNFCRKSFSIGKPDSLLRIPLALFHYAVFCKNNEQLTESLSKVAVKIFSDYINYACDEHGILATSQLGGQRQLAEALYEVISFAENNMLDGVHELKTLKQRAKHIFNFASHITDPNGYVSPIGDTAPDLRLAFIDRSPSNFIRPASNIAFLEDKNSLSYITIGGGKNTKATYRHCDLLSFTWTYDGVPIFLDSGAGRGQLDLYAVSAIAHNALICDDADYVTPNYMDWTAIDEADEKGDWVRISMHHELIDGVRLARTIVWIKPNIVLLVDEGVSAEKHTYSQNFILGLKKPMNIHSSPFSKGTAPKVVFKLDKEHIVHLWQHKPANIILTEFQGTDQVDDVLHYRGSRIKKLKHPVKGQSLVFSLKGSKALFLTSIECRGATHASEEQRLKEAMLKVGQLTVITDKGKHLIPVPLVNLSNQQQEYVKYRFEIADEAISKCQPTKKETLGKLQKFLTKFFRIMN